MGGQKSTTTTTVTQTPEEKEYTRQQIELAKQQLALTQEEHGWQSEIYAITKPLLEKYGLMVSDEFDRYNTPEAQALRDKYASLENAQLDSQIRNLPVQDELLQLQLDEIRRGGRATDEQKALIGEIANRAIETGDTDISRFLDKGFQQLREDLAPARGLRPTDSPMLDAGGQVLEEALRQKGQLTSQVRGAQANAELNFPLNASQVYSAQNQFQQNFNANMGQFLSQQRQTAEQNRSALMQQLFTAPMSAREQGISLINAARPSPVSFPRNTTETTKTSGGSILGGIGGLLSGIGSIAGSGLFSSEKFKENVRPIKAPEGHVLSPGGLKEYKKQIGAGYGPNYKFPPRFGNNTGLVSDQMDRPAFGTTQQINFSPWWQAHNSDRNYPDLRPDNTTMSFDSPSAGLGFAQAEKPPGPDMVVDPPRSSGGALTPAGPNDTPTTFVGGMPMKNYNSDGWIVDPTVWGEGKKPPDEGPQSAAKGLGFANPPQTDEDALDRIANLDVSSWQYKPETGLGTETHIGPMAEDFNTQIMGKGPEPTISVVDSLGALTSAVKALERRTSPKKQKTRVGAPRPYWGIQNERGNSSRLDDYLRKISQSRGY